MSGPKTMNVAQAVEEWLTHLERDLPAPLYDTDRHIDQMLVVVDDLIVPYLGELTVDALTPEAVEAWTWQAIDRMTPSTVGIHPHTARDILNAFISWATSRSDITNTVEVAA